MNAAAGQAFIRLAEFLADGRLTGVVASLEQALSGRGAQEAADAARAAGFEPALLEAALRIRRDLAGSTTLFMRPPSAWFCRLSLSQVKG